MIIGDTRIIKKKQKAILHLLYTSFLPAVLSNKMIMNANPATATIG